MFEQRKAVILSLVEGNSINATVRMTGVSKPTILKLLADLGNACAQYHDKHVRGLKPDSVQCDEVWSFNYCRDKTRITPLRGAGGAWTWTALDPDTKLIITYHLGLRTRDDAHAFMDDLSGRVINLGQITTDGFTGYPAAVREAFGSNQDDTQGFEQYVDLGDSPERRYSPSTRTGSPDPAVASTSHLHRDDLTIRMHNRRFTRLTNDHSKKMEKHFYALALFFMYYNYCRPHQSLKGNSPAMAAGLADHVWSVEELIGLLD